MKKDHFIQNSFIRFISYSFLVAVLFLLSGCEKAIAGNNEPGNEINPDSIKGLKDYYKDFFPFGVAVLPTSLTGSQSALILEHYGSLTAENVMKVAPIHPEGNRYYWDNADKIVNYAKANGILMRGYPTLAQADTCMDV